MGIIRKLFRAMFLAGHPLLWVVLAVSLYGNHHYRERLYWEVPSVPFQPFCSPKNDWEFSRPVNTPISLTDEFIRNLALEFARRGVTNRIQLNPRYSSPDGKEYRHRILVSRLSYQDTQTMITATEFALYITYDIRFSSTIEDVRNKLGFTMFCEDIEGKVNQF